VLGCARDVTKRRQMEFDMRESEKRFRGLFENSLQPMFQSTVEGKLLNVNRAFLKTFGYQSLLELVDFNVVSLYVNPALREEVVSRTQRQGFLSNFQLQLKKKDGTIITVVENSRALQNEAGEIIGFEGILEDVTVRRSMELKLSIRRRA
jgi:PAS domain S-box-containing protein